MRILTANIQNFPANAPDEKYASKENADFDAIKALDPDVVLWQELAEKRDFARLVHEFGNDTYGHAAHKSECVITWHRALLALQGSTRTVHVADGMGAGSASPPRFDCVGTFEVKGLPPVTVIDLHFTNSAYNANHIKARQPHWDSCWANTKALVDQALNAGHIVIVGGDWNRAGKDIPKFHPDQQWIVGGGNGIDNVALLCPKGWAANVHGRIDKNINSDHNVKGADVNFEQTPAAKTPTPPKPTAQPSTATPVHNADHLTPTEQAAVDALAKARSLLRGVGTPEADKALTSTQDAINALYDIHV